MRCGITAVALILVLVLIVFVVGFFVSLSMLWVSFFFNDVLLVHDVAISLVFVAFIF